MSAVLPAQEAVRSRKLDREQLAEIARCGRMCERALAVKADCLTRGDAAGVADWADRAEDWSRHAFGWVLA